MPVVIALLGVLMLLLLITVAKMNAFLSFVIVGLLVGLAMGLPIEEIIGALKRGIGDTLGLLVLILGFGAMLFSLLFALFTLGLRNGKKMKEAMNDLAGSISSIAMILLIIAGAGALKEILVSSGISEYLGELLRQSGASPLLLAWLIAAAIRIAVGSATVAGLTAAGIVLPLVSDPSVSPELMVLSIGAGSLVLSHVNDGGFWLFKEYFNLTVKETLKTWTVMETTIAVVGLGGVLLLNVFV